MSFQSPLNMLWFVPPAFAVIALYLLKMRRTDLKVPAVFLWPARVDEVRANSLFQRLRFSWLMVLQLFALLVMAVVVAQPQMRQQGLEGKLTVAVLDASASMGAIEKSGTRFDSAKEAVRGMIEAVKPGEKLALIEAGPVPRVVFPLGDDRPKQRAALEALRVSDAESELDEALRLAAALVGTSDGSSIVVLSDGATKPVTGFSPGKASVVYKSLGETTANLSASALGATTVGDKLMLYAAVHNWDKAPASYSARVEADGNVVDAWDGEAGPGKTVGKTLSVPAGTKTCRLVIERGGGALKADDDRTALLERAGALRVLLVGPGDFFLEKALALDPRVSLDRAASVPASERSGSPGEPDYDLVVFAGAPEIAVKASSVLTFGRAGPASPVTRNGATKNMSHSSSEPVPLLQGVDFDEVFVDKGEVVEPKPTGSVVARTDKGPLVVTAAGKKRQVYVAFDPLDSDFPLSVGFPIFCANALTFLAGDSVSNEFVVRAGEPFSLPARGAQGAVLTSPDGKESQIKARNELFNVSGLNTVGKYTLVFGSKQRTLYVALKSDTESDISPKSELSIEGTALKSQTRVERFADTWRPFALLAMAVLAIEWWFYSRRS